MMNSAVMAAAVMVLAHLVSAGFDMVSRSGAPCRPAAAPMTSFPSVGRFVVAWIRPGMDVEQPDALQH